MVPPISGTKPALDILSTSKYLFEPCRAGYKPHIYNYYAADFPRSAILTTSNDLLLLVLLGQSAAYGRFNQKTVAV